MIELMDLSSAIQLACGINFAGSVIMDRHSRYIARCMEYVDYVRSVVLPRANAATRETLENRVVAAENEIFTARFALLPYIRRLQALCFIAGIACTLALVAPAFSKPFPIETASALGLLVAMFCPIPLALVEVERRLKKFKPAIDNAQDRLQKAVHEALRSDA
ncbi:hypothetical protein E7V67_001965 [[Empedobacter] haloabium]|uniref:DUF2721 domain-containing protein n=1 Tax=[Empedobacter] haloabium TaxID=592317 RepID=A0ABZ1UN12_9BURK